MEQFTERPHVQLLPCSLSIYNMLYGTVYASWLICISQIELVKGTAQRNSLQNATCAACTLFHEHIQYALQNTLCIIAHLYISDYCKGNSTTDQFTEHQHV